MTRLEICPPERTAIIEVKLGHLMDRAQQKKYEDLASSPTLFLAALRSDEVRLELDSDMWTFLSLSDIISSWKTSDDEFARLLAAEAASVLDSWDALIAGVFSDRSSEARAPLSGLNQKFLGRVVGRRIARDLRERGRLAFAGVTSGGGLPLIAAWSPIRNGDEYSTFIAEIRWWGDKPGGELRFGVDFETPPGQQEDEDIRRAAYDLARSMDAEITHDGLSAFFAREYPHLNTLLSRTRSSRPKPRGDWEQVIAHGFEGARLASGKKNSRRQTKPDFYGDGTLRFQAITEINFAEASAIDATNIMDATLDYLILHQP